jgi:hypothetical protein
MYYRSNTWQSKDGVHVPLARNYDVVVGRGTELHYIIQQIELQFPRSRWGQAVKLMRPWRRGVSRRRRRLDPPPFVSSTRSAIRSAFPFARSLLSSRSRSLRGVAAVAISVRYVLVEAEVVHLHGSSK